MPPKRRTVLKEISLEHLNLEDVFCIACRCIYIQPVTMPCGHTLCLECFKNMVNLTAYQCPTCRMRISNWLRKYKDDWESLVNQNLWKALQLQYPVEVQKKLNNEDDGIEERIATNGFTRVEIQKGEIKKEFESMMVNFQQEQKEQELQGLKLAKELQEAEEAITKTSKATNEKLTKDDVHLALTIQEEIQKEFKQEDENNRCLALQLQEKQKLPKKGPLDKMFAKSTLKNSKTLYSSSEYGRILSNSSSLSNQFHSFSTSSNLCTSSSVTDSCSSFSFPDPCTSSSVTDSCSSFSFSDRCTSFSVTDSGIFEDNNLDTCSCGRLEDNFNSSLPPCKFCSDQIALFDKISTQNDNDFLMAKKLQESYRKENFEDYNLRKRSASQQQKSCKVPKKQLTLTEALNKSFKNDK